jgi:phenylacetate-CoA ligase
MSMLRTLPKFLSTVRDERIMREELYARQRRRLHKLLQFTLSNSPFYSRLYAESGITLKNIDEICLSDLPIVDKNMVMENFDSAVCSPDLEREPLERFIADKTNIGRKYKGKYTVIHTSGTSGTIGIFVYGPSAWARVKALAFRRIGQVKISPFYQDRYAFVGAIDGNYAAASLSRDIPRVVGKSLCLSINEQLDKLVDALNRFQPTILCGYASGIKLVAEEKLAGRLSIYPRRIMCTGDPLTPSMRAAIAEAFGIQPHDFIGASEAMTFGIECDEHYRHHLFEDWVLCEALDDKAAPVPSGTPGQLCLTNLYNYNQPLIRYALNDEVVISDEPCPCGRPFRVLEKIAGRKGDFLWFTRADGSREFIHPIVLAEFFVPGLQKCQFIQSSAGTLTIRAVMIGQQNAAVNALRDRMNEILTQKGLSADVRIEVQLTGAIDNDMRTGKFRLVVPFKPDSL